MGVELPRLRRLGVHCALALALAGCAYVKLDKEGKRVELRDAAQLAPTCQKIGKVNARTLAKVLFVRRSEQKIASELSALARNEAGGLGGDTITAASPAANGEQSFDVYRCSLT